MILIVDICFHSYRYRLTVRGYVCRNVPNADVVDTHWSCGFFYRNSDNQCCVAMTTFVRAVVDCYVFAEV